jgi:hypothetical protein
MIIQHSTRRSIALGLAILLLMVSACAISDADPATEASSTSTNSANSNESLASDAMLDVIETYLTSWETKDETALRASVTDDFVLHEYIYRAGTGRRSLFVEDDADGIVEIGFDHDWHNEILGDSVVLRAGLVGDSGVSGDGPWIVRHREVWQQASEHQDGIATYTLVNEGGTLKIARHSFAGFNWYSL